MQIVKVIAVLGVMSMVAACGETTGDRAISGAGLGAATGAAAGALTGGSVGTGALIGAGIGAAGGALTDKDDVNFGKPIWK